MEGIDIFELATPDALSGDGQNTLFHPCEVELAETTKAVVDICSRADTVVLCRHFELDGALHKAVSVLKKRTGPHESEIRELRLGSGGVSAGQRLFKFRGILSGITEFEDDKVAPLGLQGNGP
jgi:circadian clock protein KaiC